MLAGIPKDSLLRYSLIVLGVVSVLVIAYSCGQDDDDTHENLRSEYNVPTIEEECGLMALADDCPPHVIEKLPVDKICIVKVPAGRRVVFQDPPALVRFPATLNTQESSYASLDAIPCMYENGASSCVLVGVWTSAITVEFTSTDTKAKLVLETKK